MPSVGRAGPRVLRAAALAGVLGGAPSTLWTLRAGGDVAASTRAAGELLFPGRPDSRWLLAAGAAVHGALSIAWAAVLTVLLPRRHTVAAGALAGAAIATLDLGIARVRFPSIAAQPLAPQVADHVAFGALVALTLRYDERSALDRPSA